jgi:hypothetical protein
VAASDIAKPGVQKPHCEPWHSTSACCAGCSASPPMRRRSSTVSSALPSSVGRKRMQALTVRSESSPTRVASADGVPTPRACPASSATITVQAPQSPSLQPSFVPVQRASSRSQFSTVRVGATPSTLTISPRSW